MDCQTCFGDGAEKMTNFMSEWRKLEWRYVYSIFLSLSLSLSLTRALCPSSLHSSTILMHACHYAILTSSSIMKFVLRCSIHKA